MFRVAPEVRIHAMILCVCDANVEGMLTFDGLVQDIIQRRGRLGTKETLSTAFECIPVVWCWSFVTM